MNKKGFTLIELLVVIAIIGILAVIILAALSQARKSARDAKRKEAVRNVMTAIETYASVNDDTYPQSWEDLGTDYLSAIPEQIDQANSVFAPDSYCIISTGFEAKPGNYFYAKNGISDTTDNQAICQ